MGYPINLQFFQMIITNVYAIKICITYDERKQINWQLNNITN